MKSKLITAASLLWILAAISCGGGEGRPDAYGNFEGLETVVSAETGGRLISVNVEEGSMAQKGRVAAVVDTAALSIQKRELMARLAGAEDEIRALESDINAKLVQLENLEREESRVAGMFGDSAATERELDRIRTELAAMEQAVDALRSRRSGLVHNREAMKSKVELAEENISKSVVRNPIEGTVLEKFRRAGEMVMPGTSLYSIQDLSELDLRVYVSGGQLSSIRLGDSVDVYIDRSRDKIEKLWGKIVWISDTAEFTPKIIQTRDVRVDLVYAVRIRVANDGRLKIGMPGEARFRGRD